MRTNCGKKNPTNSDTGVSKGDTDGNDQDNEDSNSSWFSDFWGNLGDLLTQAISGLLSIVSSIWDGIKSILSFLGDILTAIGKIAVDVVKGIIEGIVSFFQFLVDFVGSFFSLLGDLFSSFFGVVENAFSEFFIDTQSKFAKKVGLNMGTIEDLSLQSQIAAYSNAFPIDPIKLHIMGVSKTIDLSFMSKIQPTTYSISTGICAIWICWYNYRKVISLIRGNAPITGQNPSGGDE